MSGERGFILKNETLSRFQPVGVTWNDSYCRSITDSGPSGCFIERDLYFENITDSVPSGCFIERDLYFENIIDFDLQEYSYEGKLEQD